MDSGFNGRHRDKDGEINSKHGNTLVSTLRKIYAASFAAEQPESANLPDFLAELEEVIATPTRARPWRGTSERQGQESRAGLVAVLVQVAWPWARLAVAAP